MLVDEIGAVITWLCLAFFENRKSAAPPAKTTAGLIEKGNSSVPEYRVKMLWERFSTAMTSVRHIVFTVAKSHSHERVAIAYVRRVPDLMNFHTGLITEAA